MLRCVALCCVDQGRPWKAHASKVEETIAMSSVRKVESRSMREGREKLGMVIEHAQGELFVEAVSERAKVQWTEALQGLLK